MAHPLSQLYQDKILACYEAALQQLQEAQEYLAVIRSLDMGVTSSMHMKRHTCWSVLYELDRSTPLIGSTTASPATDTSASQRSLPEG